MSATFNDMLARQLRYRAWRVANARTAAGLELTEVLARLKHAGAPDEAQWAVIGHYMDQPSQVAASDELFAFILAEIDRVALMPPRADPTPLPYPDPAAADAPFPLPPLPAPFPPLINRPTGGGA